MSNNGPVIKVVNKAIIIIIEKISGPKIPRSYPIFKTISSIRPRVFIKAPKDNESFHVRPTIFAVMELPASLPITATLIIIIQNIHKCPSFKTPI